MKATIHTPPASAKHAGLRAAQDTRAKTRLRTESLAPVVVFVVCAILLGCMRFLIPGFGNVQQFISLMTLASFLIVIAFGQGLVVYIGGLDLSIPSTVTLGGVLAAGWIGAAATPALWMYGAALAVCVLVGVCNGLGILVLRIPPFMMTLASGIIVYSLCLGATDGSPRGAAPPMLQQLMSGQTLGLPTTLIFLIVFMLLAWLLQSHCVFGRQIAALGASPRAAYIAGLRTHSLTITVYALSSLCAGWVGMMLVGYSNGATLRMGDSYLLPSVAAIVIGGSSIFGGRGRFIGTVGGALLLTILTMIITSLGLAPGWRTFIEGSVILFALLLMQDQFLARVVQLLPTVRKTQKSAISQQPAVQK